MQLKDFEFIAGEDLVIGIFRRKGKQSVYSQTR